MKKTTVQWYCDRCKRLVMAESLLSTFDLDDQSFDLCKECTTELRKFLGDVDLEICPTCGKTPGNRCPSKCDEYH